MDFCDQVVPTSKDSSRGGQKVRLWVVHDEEIEEQVNSAYDVAHYLATSTVRASINACVDAEKVVGQVDWTRTAWHANHAATNACSIGIEHEGFAHQSREEWLDPARGSRTLHRSALLFRDVGMHRYGIQPVRLVGQALVDCVLGGHGSGYCGHKDVTEAFHIQGGHTDPGTAFPYDVWVGWAIETAPPPPAPPPPKDEDMRNAFLIMPNSGPAPLPVYIKDGEARPVHCPGGQVAAMIDLAVKGGATWIKDPPYGGSGTIEINDKGTTYRVWAIDPSVMAALLA